MPHRGGPEISARTEPTRPTLHQRDRIRPWLDASVAALALFIAGGVAIAGMWRAAVDALTDFEFRRLRTVIQMVAANLDADPHAKVLPADHPERKDALTHLRILHGQIPAAVSLRTFTLLDGVATPMLTTTEGFSTTDPAASADLNAELVPLVRNAILNNQVLLLTPDRTRNGQSSLAIAPIVDGLDAPTAAVALELDASHLLREQHAAGDAALLAMIPCLIATGGFGLLVFRQRRRELHDQLALRAAQAAAERASHAKSNFLANMSHEIRTPMTVVIGYAELLEDDTLAPDQRLQYLRHIQRSGEHLVSLINDILDVAKIEAGKVELNFTHFDPADVLRDVHQLMTQRAAQKDLFLNLNGLESLPKAATSDPIRLKQILVNIVGNAIKFTHKGGITINASHHRDALGGRLEIAVTDTGIGIARDAIARLFRPFEQEDASITRRFGGTGLGLALSRRLATMLGGGIEVASTQDVGSTFTLWIDSGHQPELRSHTTQTQPGERKPRPDIRLNGRILIADDAADTRTLAQAILADAGADVHAVTNGVELIQAVEQNASRPFDLILTDVHMPELDGYRAATELRRRAITTPIVALTAQDMSEHRLRCQAAGMDDYITKPFQRQHLLETCARWLSRDNPDHPAKAPTSATHAHHAHT